MLSKIAKKKTGNTFEFEIIFYILQDKKRFDRSVALTVRAGGSIDKTR